MQFRYSFLDLDNYMTTTSLIELRLINDILTNSIEDFEEVSSKISESVYKRCLEIKENLIKLPQYLSLNKIDKLSELKLSPWYYEELLFPGFYNDKHSIRLTDKDRLIFKDNIGELIIIEVLFHYPITTENFEGNIIDEDDKNLLCLLKYYLSFKNLGYIIEELYQESIKYPDKIWFFDD
jgi:hypothetical protein